MRLHDPHEPSLYSEPRRLRTELTDADRKLIRLLSKADWSAADVEALRRDLLVEHLPAVAAMLADWKIDIAGAAKLFRVGETKMASLCREHREGTFDLAMAPPASREEKVEWRKTVVAEIAALGSGGVDNVAAFWRRLRREKRLRLSLNEVRTLVRSFVVSEPAARLAA
jgi:hypothetical protein